MIAVSFTPSQGEFVAAIPLAEASRYPELRKNLLAAAKAYRRRVVAVLKALEKTQTAANGKRQAPRARLMWRVGDEVFKLIEDLRRLELTLDGLYEHFARDTGVKRQRLQKVLIMRRYVPRVSLIPAGMSWQVFEHGTKREAMRIANE